MREKDKPCGRWTNHAGDGQAMCEIDKPCGRWTNYARDGEKKDRSKPSLKKSVLIARHGIVLYFPNGMVTALILAEDNYKTDSL